MSDPAFFTGVHAIILDQGLGKARAQILAKQLEGRGGLVERALSRKTTHIVIGSNVRLARVPHLLKVEAIPESIRVVRADWLSACLVKGEKVDLVPYIARPEDTTSSPVHSATLLKSTPARTEPSSGSSQFPVEPSKSKVNEEGTRAVPSPSDAEKNVTSNEQQKVPQPNATASPQKVTYLHAKFLYLFSRDHDIIKIGPECLEQKGNVLHVVRLTMHLTFDVLIFPPPPIAIYV